MNIIKETLEKTLNELYTQIESKEKEHDKILTSTVHSIVDPIDELFKEFNIRVSSTEITFNHKERNEWYGFRIQRRSNYGSEPTYTKATIASSSYSELDENGLKMVVCTGLLARHCLYETDQWKDLVNVMNSRDHLYKTEIKELTSQTYNIRSEIDKIEREEQNKEFNDLFNKNTFRLNKRVDFYYGVGRWARIYSDEFFWEENKGGKTYTVYYIDERRTNPHYDENGHPIEPIIERVKRSIDKRVKRADVEGLVRSNMNLVS